jgi:hypothetical protein
MKVCPYHNGVPIPRRGEEGIRPFLSCRVSL